MGTPEHLPIDDAAAAEAAPKAKKSRNPSLWLVGEEDNASIVRWTIEAARTAEAAVEKYAGANGTVIVFALRPDAEPLRFTVRTETITNTVIEEA